MKPTTLFAVASALAFSSFSARAVLPGIHGPVTISLTAMAESYSYKLTGSSTNHSGTNTIITTVYKSKTTNAPIDAPAFLALLANSFNTTFPAGAKLMISGSGSFSFLVVDKTGTNILLDVGSVVSIEQSATLHSGIETFIRKFTPSRILDSGTDTEMYTELVTLSYDDGGMGTKDGTVTSFQLSGILTETSSVNIQNGKTTLSVNFHGAGSGQIHGKEGFILNGTVTGALSGFET